VTGARYRVALCARDGQRTPGQGRASHLRPELASGKEMDEKDSLTEEDRRTSAAINGPTDFQRASSESVSTAAIGSGGLDGSISPASQRGYAMRDAPSTHSTPSCVPFRTQNPSIAAVRVAATAGDDSVATESAGLGSSTAAAESSSAARLQSPVEVSVDSAKDANVAIHAPNRSSTTTRND
jgi:hypothetical protein